MSTDTFEEAPAASRSALKLLSALIILIGIVGVSTAVMGASGRLVLAWLLICSGIGQLLYVSGFSRRRPFVKWAALVAGLYLGAGVWLVMHASLAVANLLFALTVFFVAEGILDVVISLAIGKISKRGGSAWILLQGVAILAMVRVVWIWGRPSSDWGLGVLAGSAMLLAGVLRFVMAVIMQPDLECSASSSRHSSVHRYRSATIQSH